jgi:hypothetical protein
MSKMFDRMRELFPPKSVITLPCSWHNSSPTHFCYSHHYAYFERDFLISGYESPYSVFLTPLNPLVFACTDGVCGWERSLLYGVQPIFMEFWQGLCMVSKLKYHPERGLELLSSFPFSIMEYILVEKETRLAAFEILKIHLVDELVSLVNEYF